MKPDLRVLEDRYMIVQTDRNSGFPEWIDQGSFYSFTVTDEETSIVCRQTDAGNEGILKLATDRRIIKLSEPFDLSLTGIIAGISGILAESGIPVFTISTYNTDYILIIEKDLEKALSVLRESGYRVIA